MPNRLKDRVFIRAARVLKVEEREDHSLPEDPMLMELGAMYQIVGIYDGAPACPECGIKPSKEGHCMHLPCACVARARDGFEAGVLVVEGGEVTTSRAGIIFPTREEAIRAASRRAKEMALEAIVGARLMRDGGGSN